MPPEDHTGVSKTFNDHFDLLFFQNGRILLQNSEQHFPCLIDIVSIGNPYLFTQLPLILL